MTREQIEERGFLGNTVEGGIDDADRPADPLTPTQDVERVLNTIPDAPTNPKMREKEMAYLPGEMRLLRDHIRSLAQRLEEALKMKRLIAERAEKIRVALVAEKGFHAEQRSRAESAERRVEELRKALGEALDRLERVERNGLYAGMAEDRERIAELRKLIHTSKPDESQA